MCIGGDYPMDTARIWEQEQATGIQILLAELKACSRRRDLEWGRRVHAQATNSGHDSNISVANALINMYAKCRSMPDARQVFDRMSHSNVVSWNVLILGYAANGQGLLALDLFTKMTRCGPPPSSVTLVAALKACTSVAVKAGASIRAECRRRGREIHWHAIEHGCYSDIYVQSTLIDFYAKCGSMVEARQVFNSIEHPNVVSWTALILGYADNGQGLTAMDLFGLMRNGGYVPNTVTFVAALKACISLGGSSGLAECRKRGKEVHKLAVDTGCHSDIYVQSTLIDMYSKCRCMVEARRVFDSMKHANVVSWSALISGYVEDGQSLTALDLFTRMRSEGPAPDSVSFVAALRACSSLALKAVGVSELTDCRERGKEIHDCAVDNGCLTDIYLLSTLIDMYAKCGSMEEAHQVFDSTESPNVVCWTALIMGYADNGQGFTSLALLTRMRKQGPAPDPVTFAAALKACGLVGGLEFGRTIQAEIDYNCSQKDVVLVTCLVDFYAKCGSLVEAQNIFDMHPATRNTVTWNALLAGFSSSGDHEAVFQLYKRMQDACCNPDSITFLSLLKCCSHAGLVDKGKACFEEMSTRSGIAPSVEHYSCMVDIFGRANKLDDAMALLECMPCSPNDVTWKTVLGACCRWKNAGVGRLAFQSLMHLNDSEAAAFVLMGQLYGSKGMLQEREMVLGLRERFQAWRKPGETFWTNEVGEVHTFGR